jgi:hypothetical protein
MAIALGLIAYPLEGQNIRPKTCSTSPNIDAECFARNEIALRVFNPWKRPRIDGLKY